MALSNPRRTCLAFAVAFAGAVVAAPVGVRADRLDKEACEALRSEESGLIAAGVKGDMDKGPDWAKANLAPERLQQVGRLIEIGEQIAFRCRVVADPGKRKKGKKAQDAGKANDTKSTALEELTGPIATAKPAKPASPAKPAQGESAKTAAPAKPSLVKLKTAKPAAAAAPAVSPAEKRKAPVTAKVRKSLPPKQSGLFSFD